jgi:hypothetical protein
VKFLAAIALAAGALLLSATASPAGPRQAVPRHPLGLIPRVEHGASLAPAVQAATKTAGFNCVVACADYEATVNQFFTDVAADGVNNVTTNVYSVLPQYSSLDSTTFDSTTNAFVDESPYPTTKTCHDGFDKYCVTNKQLQTEIGKVIAAHGWPTQSSTALYVILTPANVGVCQRAGKPNFQTNACTTNAFCAYHSATSSFLYVVEPDDAAVKGDGCDSESSPAGNAADSTLSTLSHEHIEAITDPRGDGWWTEDNEQFGAFFGAEIGDLCAWNFGDPAGTTLGGQAYNQVINGHDYWLQQEYSNADTGCVQSAGGTVSTPDPNSPFYSGTGPLVFHQGPVMTTNTVYAIYWVPAAPANSAPPKIAGAAKVGKTLKALSGVWSNSPKLAYRWLRCSTAGTSCHGIRRATTRTYKPVPADTRHRLEVRVTGSNIAGSSTATSAPTAKVRS